MNKTDCLPLTWPTAAALRMFQAVTRAGVIILTGTAMLAGAVSAVNAAEGDVLATFPFQSSDMISDPAHSYMYASVPALDAVEVISTKTLAVIGAINLPGAPQGMSLSPDGSTLYVADTSNNSIDAIDTGTLSLARSLPLTSAPYDVASGSDNRLYVQAAGAVYTQIEQINGMTGATLGPAYGSGVLYYGDLQLSPDGNSLYYGEHGLSPNTLYALDVSTTTISQLREIETGENGKETVLSHDGTLIAQPNGYPYQVELYNASTFAPLGSFNTGAYPDALAFSPDDKIAYVSHSVYPTAVDVYGTSSFALSSQFLIPDQSSQMITDSTGRELFVSFTGAYNRFTSTVVYDTGVAIVPEPGSLILLNLGAIGLFILTRRRKLLTGLGSRKRNGAIG